MSEKELILKVSHLQKSFGNHAVLNDIDFEVCKGDVVSIIGASGSGKSTMLRCINLLEEPGEARFCFTDRISRIRRSMCRLIVPRWVWCSRISTCLII